MKPYHLTKITRFFDKIRKNKYIQIILGILPGLFCFLFTSAFLIDTINVFGVMSINSKFVAESQTHNMFLDVDSYNTILNMVKSPNTFTVTPDKNGFVCNIEVDGLGYSFHNGTDKAWIPEVVFVKFDTTEDLYYINGSKDGFVEPQTAILCKIYYREGKFYTKDGFNEKEIEDTLNFIVNEDGTIEVKPMFYEPIITKDSVYFVNCLDDEKLHYDGIRNMYVRNVTKDFLKDFLVGTNILVFSLIVILYVSALIYANKQYHLEYFTSKSVIVVNVAGMIALLLGLLLAVILLI